MSMVEFHHAYFGLVAFGFAWVAIFRMRPGRKRDIVVWSLGLFAVWMIGDDLFQHWMQGNDPDYLSPVHRLYVYLFGGLHRKVVGWFK